MSVNLADLYVAINAAWESSGLNALFLALRPAGTINSNFSVLCDQEASPGQPHPYCVIDQITNSNTKDRMTDGVEGLRETRDIPVRFNVYAKEVVGDIRSAKVIAAYLAEELMKVFGGHPTVSPTGTITLSNGNHLQTRYENDFGIRLDDDEYQWHVAYSFKLDVPVAI